MFMLKKNFHKLVIKNFIFALLLFLTFTSCKEKKTYIISNTSDFDLIEDLMLVHGELISDNNYNFSEVELGQLLKDIQFILEVYTCNFDNYINGSDVVYYKVIIENKAVNVCESSDFIYVWQPDNSNAILDGPYKGYIKQDYFDFISEFECYTKILSFYKALSIYYEKINSSYLSNFYSYEYLNDLYIKWSMSKM